MKYYTNPLAFCLTYFVVFAGLASAQSLLPATDTDGGKVISCNEFLVPKVEIKGKLIGQDDCRLKETDFTFLGRKFRRMDMGISGTIDGYLPKEGLYDFYIGSNPEFTHPQVGSANPLFYGISRYEADKGSAVIFIYPSDRSTWNGKMFVTAHGAGASFKLGTLKAWDKNLDPSNPLADISKYEKLMLEKGYAVAKTKRSTPKEGGDTIVTLEHGTVLTDKNVSEQPRLIMGFAKVGWNVLQKRLGQKPTRTYWYGHSGGARPGRIVNYQTGLNVDFDCKHIIDGIIADDAAAGQWLPVVMKDGKDILFTDQEDLPWFVTETKGFRVEPSLFSGAKHKDWFVPLLEITHLLYVNETAHNSPSWMSTNFLANKRFNARILRDKGLGHKHRMYEIAGISHSGGEYFPEGRRGDIQILDMSRMMDRFIDMLDNWVEKGAPPPPTKSEWRELGDVNKDGIVENGAVTMPDVACPLGVYYIFPPSSRGSGQGTTGFAPFTGEGLEPLDGRGPVEIDDPSKFHNYVDMNRNGYRDFVETVTEAWQRLGLIQHNEKFSRQRYAVCIQAAVDKLLAEKFIAPKTANFYVEQAATIRFPSP